MPTFAELITAGRSLSVAAWLFGAIILGSGNAYFDASVGVSHVQMHASPVATASDLERCHEEALNGLAEPLPAHCLFCLDGLASADPELPDLLLYSWVAFQRQMPDQWAGNITLSLQHPPQSRGPPAFSPAPKYLKQPSA